MAKIRVLGVVEGTNRSLAHYWCVNRSAKHPHNGAIYKGEHYYYLQEDEDSSAIFCEACARAGGWIE